MQTRRKNKSAAPDKPGLRKKNRNFLKPATTPTLFEPRRSEEKEQEQKRRKTGSGKASGLFYLLELDVFGLAASVGTALLTAGIGLLTGPLRTGCTLGLLLGKW